MKLRMILAAVVVSIAIFPLVSQADDAAECMKQWKEMTSKSSDGARFDSFGEKFCECSKPGTKKSTDVCMAQTTLSETIANMSFDKETLTADDFENACNDEWVVLYSGLTGKTDTTKKSKYCTCIAPKLEKLNLNKDNVSEQEQKDNMDKVAEECA